MADATIKVSVKGKWVSIPALNVGSKHITVGKKWLRIAAIDVEEWLDTELENPELCIEKLRQQESPELRGDIFTFAQMLPNTQPRYAYPIEWESVAAFPTSSFKEWWEGLPQETRKNVRRSQKRGVVIKVEALSDELITGIMGVNNDSPMRQGVPHAHYGKTFEQTKYDQSSFLDRSDFICAYVGNELIGFLKIVYRGNIASILQILPKSSHFDKRPSNALVAKAVELCEAKGISYLTYGLFNYGNKRHSPLREFKIRNGFGEILVPRYYVPLTMKGKLCMKLKLHRGLIGILPHSVITAIVSARSKWYNLKQPQSRCSSMPERPNRTRQTECSNPPAGSNS